MSKNRIIHARVDDETHDQLLEKCNELGCTLSEYFESVLTSSLEDEPKSEPKYKAIIDENKPAPKAQVIKVSYDDGKTWVNLK